MNMIGMHMQNGEFKNIGFLPIWVFGSQELEDHMSHPDFHAITLKLINHDKMWFVKFF